MLAFLVALPLLVLSLSGCDAPLAGSRETITISAEAPVLQTTTASTGQGDPSAALSALISGVDIALWDLRGLRAGNELPVARSPLIEGIERRTARRNSGRLSEPPPTVAGEVERRSVPTKPEPTAVEADRLQA